MCSADLPIWGNECHACSPFQRQSVGERTPHDFWLGRCSMCRRKVKRTPGRKPGRKVRTWTGSCARMQRCYAEVLPLRLAQAFLQLPLDPLPCPALPREPNQAQGLLRKRGGLAKHDCISPFIHCGPPLQCLALCWASEQSEGEMTATVTICCCS